MKKFVIALSLAALFTGCSNPDAPSAPDPSSVPKGDGSAPKNAPGVLKQPTRRGSVTVKGGANTPAER